MMSQEQIPSQFLYRYQHFPRIYQHGHCINHQEMGMMGRQAKRNQEEDESDILLYLTVWLFTHVGCVKESGPECSHVCSFAVLVELS